MAAAPEVRATLPRQDCPVDRRSRWWILVAAGTVAVGAVVAGRPHCGFDSSWALVWAGELVHGRVPVSPPGLVLPTAHPAALLLAAVIRVGPTSASRGAWVVGTELAVVALLTGVLSIVRRAAGVVTACAAVLLVAALPALGDAVGAGTMDVAFAAACVWAVSLTQRRHRLAVGCAFVAALIRPEGWLLLALLAILGWRDPGRRRPWAAVCGLVVAPLVWIVMGAAFFGGPLAALHVTVANAAATPGRIGVGPAVHSAASAAGPVAIAVVCSTLLWARTRRPVAQELTACLAAAAVMTVAVIGLAVLGADVPSRYFLAECVLLVLVGMCVLAAVAQRLQARRALTWALVVLSLAAGVVQRAPSARSRAVATQNQEIGALKQVLAADSGCTVIAVAPIVMLPVVVLLAGRPVTITPAGFPSGCRLSARDPLTAAGAGWGAPQPSLVLESVPSSARILASDQHWTLYVP